MKFMSCLFIFICVLQLMTSGSAQSSLDSILDAKIKEALQEYTPPIPAKELSCTTVKNSGNLSSCPDGMVVTGCACGFGCGSWDIQGGNTCHCQCSNMDWTTARCCRMA